MLSVTDDGGQGSGGDGSPGGGRGIVGMRERAQLYGGESDRVQAVVCADESGLVQPGDGPNELARVSG